MSRPISDVRLDGGRLCLDFVNTIHDRHAAVPEDYLSTVERYVEWSARAIAGRIPLIVPPVEKERKTLVRDIGELRAAAHEVLASVLAGSKVRRKPLSVVNRWLSRARAAQELDRDGRIGMSDPTNSLVPLFRIVLDLVDFLSGDRERGRLRRCANTQGCGWFFIDTGRGRARRWCAMDTCGVADKMKRYRSARPASVRTTA